MQLQNFAMACGPKDVRSSSAHEHPTSLGTTLTGTVQHRRHQCTLQLTDASGSARDRRRWTAGTSLSRRRHGGRGRCDGLPGELGLRPANRWARSFAVSVRTIRRYQERYAAGGMEALSREEGWRRGRRRISGKRLRTIERLRFQGLSNRAIAHRLGVQREGDPQAGRTFQARRERTARLGRYFPTLVFERRGRLAELHWVEIPPGVEEFDGVSGPRRTLAGAPVFDGYVRIRPPSAPKRRDRRAPPSQR